MKRIYHTKLTEKQELYFDGENLYRNIKDGFKIIKLRKNTRYDVYKLTFSLSKLKYIYTNNIEEYYDKVEGNCFQIETYTGDIINLNFSNYVLLQKFNTTELINRNEFTKKTWKYIPNSIYYISEYGDMISLYGNIINFPKCGSLGNNYNVISVASGRVLGDEYYVHRIVARVFIPEGYKEGLVVNHIDGNKKNNYYKNLEWCTISENIQHAYDTGLIKKRLGEEVHSAKLTNKDVHQICELLVKERKSCKDIGKIYNVDDSIIADIKNKVNWKHLDCVKNLPEFSKRLMKFLKSEDELVINMIKEGYSNKEIFANLPKELQSVIKMSPIIETRTKVNKGLL